MALRPTPAFQIRSVGACGARSALEALPSDVVESGDPAGRLCSLAESEGALLVIGAPANGEAEGEGRLAATILTESRMPVAVVSGGGPKRAGGRWHGAKRGSRLTGAEVLEEDLQRVGQTLVGLAADLEGRTRAERVRHVHAATAVGLRERMLWGAPAAASGLSVAAEVAPAAVSNARTVVSPELVISSRVCLRLPT